MVSPLNLVGDKSIEFWTQVLFITYIFSVGLCAGNANEWGSHSYYLPVLSCINIIVVKTLPVS